MEIAHTLYAADRVTIAYRCLRSAGGRGNKIPLVMIHGAASNMSRWSQFVTQTSLGASHDMLRLDLRGHAQSLHRGRIDLEIWCDDIDAILRHEGYGRAILIGHCLGANVAMMFAARMPQRAAGLVLIEPMLRAALTGRLRRLTKVETPLRWVITLIHLLNRAGLYRRHLTSLDLSKLDEEYRAHVAEPGGTEVLMRRYASPWHDLKYMPSANFLQDLLEVIRPLPVDKIAAPFLALLSTGRTFVDPNTTEALLARLPRGEIHRLDAKHWIPTERPREMQAMIEAWVISHGDLS